jgi:AmpD protein
MIGSGECKVNIDPEGKYLLEARQVPSPNCDARPGGCDISLIVLHGISLPPGVYGGPEIDQLFTNRLDPAAHPYFTDIARLKVSSHALIRRDGEVVQYVPFTRRAWHAGDSCYAGRTACNDFSVGIELEGQDTEPYAAAQYRALAAVVRALVEAFPALSTNRIAGHCDIAPGRKTDPGPAFDWVALRSALRSAGI